MYYSIPEKGMKLPDYARELSKQIDTTRNFILVGVSLGGMIATEINEFLSPKKTIIISSAKNRKELPFRYRFQRIIPLYKIFPKRVLKGGAFIMQPLVEPDRNKDKDTFVGMLKDKDPDFLKRTIGMIMQWDRTVHNNNIFHIHGDKDKTIPIRNVNYNHLIQKGSHMMVLTRGEEISTIINSILHD
ncbi:MAG: alpha/beta hydrolase [Bacteroidetes bacterium]|nr:MAG: alpha/beta hydrolase [Bacteroidota bacterium]